MPARLTAYPHAHAALSLIAGDDAQVRIGRDADSQLCLPDPSVSRAHALLLREHGRWRLRDLGSKNGSRVDGRAVDAAGIALDGDCWLRFGDVYCEFSALSADAAADCAQRLHARRERATALTENLGRAAGLGDLLAGSLQAALELAHCDRGFLLLGDANARTYAVRAQHPHDAQPAQGAFPGSAGAVEQALRVRRALVVNDVGAEPWLASRASVITGGLHALACVPLLDDERVLGAIYVDRRGPGPAITTLDLELLQAFAERAALYIAARSARDALAAAPSPGVGDAAAAP